MLVARKRSAPSDAEKEFMKEVNDANERITKYADKIEKLKYKMKYQEIQVFIYNFLNIFVTIIIILFLFFIGKIDGKLETTRS